MLIHILLEGGKGKCLEGREKEIFIYLFGHILQSSQRPIILLFSLLRRPATSSLPTSSLSTNSRPSLGCRSGRLCSSPSSCPSFGPNRCQPSSLCLSCPNRCSSFGLCRSTSLRCAEIVFLNCIGLTLLDDEEEDENTANHSTENKFRKFS
uniref:Candidate secreted effector n=1 Tax=Meloidogyne incognita TaxID=6306 RepID=A0A914KT64_MELIC